MKFNYEVQDNKLLQIGMCGIKFSETSLTIPVKLTNFPAPSPIFTSSPCPFFYYTRTHPFHPADWLLRKEGEFTRKYIIEY